MLCAGKTPAGEERAFLVDDQGRLQLSDAPGGGAPLAFHALTPDPDTGEMLGVQTGTGDLTATHTADIYAQDHEGVYRGFGANDPVWEGGRVAENLLVHSDDLSQADWILASDASVSGTNLVSLPTNLSSSIRQQNIFTAVIGEEVILTATMSGTGKVKMRIIDAAGNENFTTPSLTATPTRYTMTRTIAGAGVVTVYFISAETDTEVTIEDVQLENATGRTDTTTPSEYCPTDTATGDVLNSNSDFSAWTADNPDDYTVQGTETATTKITEHANGLNLISDGSGISFVVSGLSTTKKYVMVFNVVSITGVGIRPCIESFLDAIGSTNVTTTGVQTQVVSTSSGYLGLKRQSGGSTDAVVSYMEIYEATTGKKVFGTENGNSVTSNVVTEAVGAPLTELPWLKYQPAATNLRRHSNNQSSTWTIDGTGTITPTTGIDGAPDSAMILNDNDATVRCNCGSGLHVTSLTGSAPLTWKIWIKKEDDESVFPELAPSFHGAGSVGLQINRKTGETAYRGNAASAVDEVVDDGDWWILMIQATLPASPDENNMQIPIYPAMSTTLGTLGTATLTGQVIIGNIEAHNNKTIAEVRGLGPIFTTSAAASTDVPAYSFDLANNEVSNGAWYAECKASFDDSEGSLAGGYWFGATNTVGYLAPHGAGNRTYDGTTVIYSTPVAWGVGDTMKFGIPYSAVDSLFNINRDGNWKADTAFDGALIETLGVLALVSFPSAAQYARSIRNFQRYDIPDYQTGKDKIDELMA